MKSCFPLIAALALLLAACESIPTTAQPDRAPVPVYQSVPKYPYELYKAGVPGSATVSFVVDTSGDVVEAKAVEATNPAFGRAAVAAVSTWKFSPGIKDGKKVNTHLQVPLYFSVNSDSPTSK